MTTYEIEMTASQEKALEYAIYRLNNSHVTRMNKADSDGSGKYRATVCEIKTLSEALGEPKKPGIETLVLVMRFDNGRPGTIGYNAPTTAQLFIGKKGGFTCYVENRKRINGRKAIIFCTN